jgi:hypothetical protein
MNKSIDEHRNIFVHIFEPHNVVVSKMVYDDIYTQHNKERFSDEKIKIKLLPSSKSACKFYENQNIKKPKPCQFISPSREYYKNTIFREKIDKFVSALDAELHVDLTSDAHLVSDTSSLKKVHTLTLFNCPKLTNVKHLSKLHTLILENCSNSIDLSPLKNLSKLTVSHCKNVTNINTLGEINELNLNGSIHMLTNANGLENVQKLNISNSQHITNVSNLKNVHTLNIQNCNNIVDVSDLGNVQKLNISNSRRVTDVSNLKNVHTLNIQNCNNIVDVSDLGNVYDLNISSCDRITNISNLGGVHKLDISYCKNILHTDSLQHVKHLIISRHHVKYLPHGLTKVCIKGLEKYSEINNLPSTITYLEVNGILMRSSLHKQTNIKLKYLQNNLK